MIFYKKIIIGILTIIIVLNSSILIKVIKAYDMPNVNNISDEDENYYGWKGYFYWFGDNNIINEKSHSWNSPPDLPRTLYAPKGDIFISGYEDNDSFENFGFKADSASWEAGRNVEYNRQHFRWEKPINVNNKRQKTCPQYDYISIQTQNENDQYIENYMDESEIKWVKRNSMVNVTVANKQNWLGDLGVILKDYIRSNSMKILADGKDCFEITSYKGSNSNTLVKSIFCRVLGYTSSSQKFSYDNYESVSSTYKMNFHIDADYTIKEAAISENGKKIGYGNDTLFKVDGAGPQWDGVVIDNNGEIKDDENDKEVYDNLKDYKVVNGFRCLIKNLHDVRSNRKDGVGIDYYNTDAMSLQIVRSDDKSKFVIINDSYDYHGDKNRLYDIDFSSGDFADKFKNYYGGIDVVFKTQDILGNETIKRIAHLEKVKPVPENGDIKVEKYDYKEKDKENYWVKSGSIFMIYTDGYFTTKNSYFKDPDIDKNYNEKTIYPTESDLIFTADSRLKNNYYIHRGLFEENISEMEGEGESEKYGINEEYEENLRGTVKTILPLDHAVKYKKKEKVNSYKNYIKSLHAFSVETDNNKYFNLYMKTGYEDNTYGFPLKDIYYSDIKNTGISLNIDGISPTGKGNVIFEAEDCILKLEAKKVFDYGGSGVKRVFAVCHDINDNGIYEDIDKMEQNFEVKNYESGKTLELKSGESNKWTLETDAKELFRPDKKYNYDKVVVEIFAEDNVGNVTRLCAKIIDVFTLKAKIVPFNNIDYEYIDGSEGPLLQQGQAALLIINTTGYAQSLEIELPDDMHSVAETFEDIRYKKQDEYQEIINITLDSSIYSDKEQIEFIIPLNAEPKCYNVPVKAYKNEEELDTAPCFRVSDNILNGVRTRLK